MSTGSEKAIVALRGGSEFWGPRVAISLVGARAMQARFHGVCRLLESLQTQKPREKANEIAALLTRCGWSDSTVDVLPLLRLLLPQADDRVYGIKEQYLAKAYAEALSLPEREADRLKGWKVSSLCYTRVSFIDCSI